MSDTLVSASPGAEVSVPPITYAYSLDEERYTGNFPSREAALAEGQRDCDRGHGEPVTVWTGRCVAIDLVSAASLGGERVIDDIRDNLDAGDYALENVSHEQAERLTVALRTALTEWAKAEGFLDGYFTVADVERHEVEAVDPMMPEPFDSSCAIAWESGDDVYRCSTHARSIDDDKCAGPVLEGARV